MSKPHLFLIAPVNGEPELVQRCIGSVLEQDYQNWSMCVMVDDADNDQVTVEAARKAAGGDKRIHVVPVEGRKYALWTRLFGIHRYCPHDGIVVMLDGDDALIGKGALTKVAREYEADTKLDFMWTQFQSSSGELGFCRDIPQGANPFTEEWVTSHMQTFRKELLWGVPHELFLDGVSYHKTGTDQALVLPILSVAKKRKFIPDVLYLYNVTNRSVPASQGHAANKVRGSNMRRYPFDKKRILLVVNGPQHQSDMRLSMGERRAPLGVLSMAAHLRARGHEVRIVDRFCSPNWFPTDEALLSWAQVLGVYVSTPNHSDAKFVIEEARRKGFKGMVAAGGPHAIIYPDQVRSWGVDFVCDAEADFLISHIVEKGSMPASYDRRVLELDTIPFPDYRLVKAQGIPYHHTWPYSGHSPVMTLNTSRSCPHACAFCETRALWGRRWVGQSAQRMMLDVEYLHRKFGAKAIYFREDNFGADSRRLMEVCALMEENREVVWTCELRADIGHREEVIDAMHRAGCLGIYVGAESGSPRMLRLMNKGITVDQTRAMCSHIKKRGMKVALSFVDNFPGETPADRTMTDQLIRECSTGIVWRNPYREPVALKVKGVQ